MAPTQNAPATMYRTKEGLGIWEHRGQVAAVGIGHSPTARRWDERVESSIGSWAIIALRNAMDDAGVSPDQVDGMVVVPAATTGDQGYLPISSPKISPVSTSSQTIPTTVSAP